MSLFEIPELAEHVGSHLTSRDLKACMRVSKTWKTLFAPLLWLHVDSRMFRTRRGNFHGLVLEDYLLTQQDRQQGDHNQRQRTTLSWISYRIRVLKGRSIDLVPTASSAVSRRTPPTVSRRIISTAPILRWTSPSTITFSRRTPSTSCSSATAATDAVATLSSHPTKIQLLSHLVRQCINLQELVLVCEISHPGDLKDCQELISNGLAGTIKDLDISFHFQCPSLSFSPTLLARGLTLLQKLQIKFRFDRCPEHKREDGEQPDESTLYGTQETEDGEPLPSLRELDVTFSFYDYTYPRLSHRFLRRCPNLERLVIPLLDDKWLHALRACDNLKSLEVQKTRNISLPLSAILKTGLPNLDTITFIDSCSSIDDENVAGMLSACRKGWRSVNISSVGPLTVDALTEHCLTLETLRLTQAWGLTSDHMQRILSDSPRLRSFVTLIEGGPRKWQSLEETHISAEDFIDADPLSGSLRPWACEATLQVFRAKISSIPRPDITSTFHGHPLPRPPLHDNPVLQEAYQGQSQEIQGRVYERLARLTRLERLDLGHEDRGDSTEWIGMKKIFEEMEDAAQQYNCLEMTLRSGLWRLDGLKEMRVLGVEQMTTMIGDEEELWMKEHWPKLERVKREWDYEEKKKALKREWECKERMKALMRR